MFMGQVPLVPHPGFRLGQAGVTCEDTPEGGKRCSDGTYHPPGCPVTPQAAGTVQGASPGGIPVVPLAIVGAAAAAGGYLLLSGRRPRMGAEPPASFEATQPEAASKLHALALNINEQRSYDAYYFKLYIDASKKRQDLVLAIADAEKAAAEQERIWNAVHNNLDQLKAAQDKVDSLRGEQAAAARDAAENRAYVDQAAQSVAASHAQADAIIDSLPSEFQADARRIVDPCYKGAPAMKGPSRATMGRGIPVRPIGLFY